MNILISTLNVKLIKMNLSPLIDKFRPHLQNFGFYMEDLKLNKILMI